MLECSKCNNIKPTDNFYIDKSRPTGFEPSCKECKKAQKKNTYLKHKTKIIEKNTNYYSKNKKYLTSKQGEYKKRRSANDPVFRLTVNLRSRLNKALQGNYKAGSAINDLGCSIEELKVHLESKFQEGMSWSNYGKWHIDHITPLITFDLTKESEVKLACHYTNLQPLWAKDNITKGAKC